MKGSHFVVLAMSAVVATPIAAQSLARHLALIGVYDAVSSLPIQDAEVIDLIGSKSQRTGPEGAASLEWLVLAQGVARIQVRRIGFRDTTLTLQADQGVLPDITLLLTPIHTLDTVTTIAKDDPFGTTADWKGFHERCDRGLPTCFANRVLDANPSRRIGELLVGAPGLQRLCRPATAPNCNTLARSAMGGRCDLRIIVDGGEWSAGSANFEAAYSPQSIKAMEYYPTAASVPSRWFRNGGCPVLLVWTR